MATIQPEPQDAATPQSSPPVEPAPRRRRRPWYLWIPIGLVVLLVIVPFGIGALLPSEFEVQAQAHLDVPPERVWAALNDHARAPFSAGMCRATMPANSTNGLPAWREDIGSSVILVRTLESEAPTRLVRHAADDGSGMTIQCEYRLAPTTSGCDLAVDARGSIAGGGFQSPIFRFLIHVAGGARNGQVDYLKSVARQAGDADAVIE